jgi:hypothetical protein
MPHRAAADRQGGGKGHDIRRVGGGEQGGVGGAVPMKRAHRSTDDKTLKHVLH